ncbi:hypothetical protein FS749_009270 [Ceratobasidium sp. UAMH 11750]|nr:hypothetical protein FS749_009270 [Ceratobasidium sp. UAMH 11750]
MAERSAAAQQIDNILTENPSYDRTPYRISLESDESGVDHLNPNSWIGDVCVRDISLRTCWDEGRALAEKALVCAGVEFDFDPGSLCALANGRPVDMMRPFGRYVGVTELIPKGNVLMSSTPNSTTAPSTTVPHPPNQSTSLAIPADAHSDTLGTTLSDSTGLELGFSDTETPLEDLLPPYGLPEIDNTPPLPGDPPKRGWVEFEGRIIHLSSAVCIILGTDSKEKSTDRLRRVCGFTRYPSLIDQSDSLLGDICLVDQIVLALVRVTDEIALAAVRVTSIRMGSNSHVESISLEHFNKPDTVLTGQILQLECQEGVWYWNQAFVTASSLKGGSHNPAHATNDTKPLLVELRARNVELVNPTLAEYHDNLVWLFKHNELVAVTDLLWAKVAEDLHEVPVITTGSDFPYQNGHDKSKLVHLDASQTIEAMPAERCGRCFLCGECVPIKQSMRTHVGKHILAKQLGLADPLRSIAIGGVPCGFCGRGETCQTTMGKGRSANTVVSDCPFFDKFSYRPAAKSTRTSPCTNRPILCEYASCPKRTFIWSYNMRAHILAKHGQDEYNNVVSQGLFAISHEEIELLQLNNPYLVPGRKKITFPSASTIGTKRPAEDSTAPSQSAAEPATQDRSGAVASGSGSKRQRTD